MTARYTVYENAAGAKILLGPNATPPEGYEVSKDQSIAEQFGAQVPEVPQVSEQVEVVQEEEPAEEVTETPAEPEEAEATADAEEEEDNG